MRRGRLTDKQLAAAWLLARRREMPLTEKATDEDAINRTTAWGLEEHGFARCRWTSRGERVRLLADARQLIECRSRNETVTQREEEIMVLTTVMLSRWLWGYATAPWIANALGFSQAKVRRYLQRLEAAGEVARRGVGSYGMTIWARSSAVES